MTSSTQPRPNAPTNFEYNRCPRLPPALLLVFNFKYDRCPRLPPALLLVFPYVPCSAPSLCAPTHPPE